MMRPRKRKVIMTLLALGTVLGYLGGAASFACRARLHHRKHFKEMVAETCVSAAERVYRR